MIKLIEIIKKDLLILFRAKSSALIVILAPFLIILLVGLSFDNSNLYKVNVDIYSGEYNELTESFVTKLSEEKFEVIKSSSESSCIDDVKNGIAHVCIIFPKNMNTLNDSNEIIFYIDYSRINMVWAIRDIVMQNVEQRSHELSTDLTDVLLQKLNDAQGEIRAQKPLVLGFTDDYVAVTSEVDNIKKNLDELQLNVNKNDFRLDDLSSESLSLQNTALSVVRQSKTALQEMKTDASNLSDSAVKADILNEIDSQISILDAADSSISSKNSNLDNILKSLNNSIDTTSSEVNAAIGKRQEMYGRIETIKQKTASSLKNIASIQNSLNKIDTSVEAIKVRDANSIINPIRTRMNPVVSEKSTLNYIFPSIIIMITLLISTILAATLAMEEKKAKAYFRNFITPTSDIIFFFGTAASTLIVMIIQLIVIILVTMAFFSSEVISSFFMMIGLLTLMTLFFIFLGMAIGYIFNSEETVILAGVSASALILLLSGFIFPLEGIPSYMTNIININPFIIFESVLRKAVLFNYSLGELMPDILKIILYVVVMMVIAVFIQQFSKRNLQIYMKGMILPASQEIGRSPPCLDDDENSEEEAEKFLKDNKKKSA